MIRQVMLGLLAMAFVSTGWTAERKVSTNKEEAIGLGSGAAIGALGGPIGLVFGAAIGGWVGNLIHDERSERLDYEQRWQAARTEVDSLNRMLMVHERDVSQLQSQLDRQSEAHRKALAQAFDVQVLFKTAQSEIDPDVEERLLRLGSLIAPMDEVLVNLEGYADPRGDADYNTQLSAERAASVREVLVRSGVPSERITLSAHGERYATAEEGDLDALALERRVRLTVAMLGNPGRVAQE